MTVIRQEIRPRKAVDILWDDIFDKDPSADRTSSAIDVLKLREQTSGPIAETFVGQFYHMTRSAYRALLDIDKLEYEEIQESLRVAANYCIQIMLDAEKQEREQDCPSDERIKMLFGIANEFTPISIGNGGKRVITLGSRTQDENEKTDLLQYDPSNGTTLPIQMKTSDNVRIADIPKGGVLICASDFGNEQLEVTDACVEQASYESTKILAQAADKLHTTIARRQNSATTQRKELERKRRAYLTRHTLSYKLGQIAPQLAQLQIQ